MQKLTAKKIIEFRRLPQKRKQTFANNLKKPPVITESGGDYWASCTSAITKACKDNNNNFINDKIDFLLEQQKRTSYKRTKEMYQRNIDILSIFRDYDFTTLKPIAAAVSTRPNPKYILNVKGLLVQVFPNHVFSFKNGQVDQVGAIWFVAQLNGFKSDELQLFSELLYKYLSASYSKKGYTINSSFCSVVDVVTQKEFTHSEIASNGSGEILGAVMSDLKAFLK